MATALLEPHRQVVNIAGNGNFLMSPGARHGHRARREQARVIVADNGTYGTIRMHQEREYPGRVSGFDLGNPDFAALARAYGWLPASA